MLPPLLKQNPKKGKRRGAPLSFFWVLCPDILCNSYIKNHGLVSSLCDETKP
jgi:hypothetical protein